MRVRVGIVGRARDTAGTSAGVRARVEAGTGDGMRQSRDSLEGMTTVNSLLQSNGAAAVAVDRPTSLSIQMLTGCAHVCRQDGQSTGHKF